MTNALKYMKGDVPGYRRFGDGQRFVYRWSDGSGIVEEAEVERVKAMAIPPAWTDVWISPSPWSHIQATGRDSSGRKRYIYHNQWIRCRGENEFGHDNHPNAATAEEEPIPYSIETLDNFAGPVHAKAFLNRSSLHPLVGRVPSPPS